MPDQPATPETDEESVRIAMPRNSFPTMVYAEFSRKLERERDAARRQLAADSQTICGLQRELAAQLETLGVKDMVEALEFYQRYWHQGPAKADWALKKYIAARA